MCANDDNECEGFKHIYFALQEKRKHIQYATQKALKLQSHMLNLTSHQKQAGEDAYRALTHQYIYRQHIEYVSASDIIRREVSSGRGEFRCRSGTGNAGRDFSGYRRLCRQL